MENKINNLWTNLVPAEINSPITIVKKQAEYLTKMTNEQLKGILSIYSAPTKELIPTHYVNENGIDITTLNNFKTFDFIIEATQLNYNITILQSTYSMLDIYPSTIADFINEKFYEVNNEKEFEGALTKIFQSKKLVTVIGNLLSQIQKD